MSNLQTTMRNVLIMAIGIDGFVENTRPEWLYDLTGYRLELDFYIPAIHTAIEVQGEQHFIYTPHFHPTYSDFETQQRYDEFKRLACSDYGVTLIEVSSKSDMQEIAQGLKSRFSPPKDYVPIDTALWDNVMRMRSVIDKKGLSYIKKLDRASVLFDAITERISNDPLLILAIEPDAALWVRRQLESAHLQLKTWEAKTLSNSKQDTPHEGYIILAQVGSLYRILHTRQRTPEEHLQYRTETRNEEHRLIYSFKVSDVIKRRNELWQTLEDKQIIDDHHKDAWFALDDMDIEFIKTLH